MELEQAPDMEVFEVRLPTAVETRPKFNQDVGSGFMIP